MLFGVFHLFHGESAVGVYEKNYPGVTYVITVYEGFGNDTLLTDQNAALEARIASWPVPSIVQVKGTWLAELDKSYLFLPPLFVSRQDCKAQQGFPEEEEKGLSKQIDALLYVGTRDSLLREQTPADIISDVEYMKELQRRIAVSKYPGELKLQDIVASAAKPFLYDPDGEKNVKIMLQNMVKVCLDQRQSHSPIPSQSSPPTATPTPTPK